MTDQTPTTPPEYATLAVTYSVELKGRHEPDTDAEGKPKTNKKGETTFHPLRLEIPATVPQLNYDEWHGYWTSLGLDPEATFAHYINYQMKQKQESEKGTLRALVTKAFKELDESTPSNGALIEKLSGRTEIKKAITDFQTAINDNLIGKPASTERNQKAERLEVATKVAEANPELFRTLAAMSPDEIKSFLATTAKTDA